MKCLSCFQCQDLLQYYLSAAHYLLWFIKRVTTGCWCRAPDGLSVPDCVSVLCYCTSMLQTWPQTARCSRWGMVTGCPNPRAGAAALQGWCEEGALLPSDRSFPNGGTSAATGALQLIPVPAGSLPSTATFPHSFCLPSAAAAAGQKSSSAITWALPGAFLVFYLSKVSITKVSLPEAD